MHYKLNLNKNKKNKSLIPIKIIIIILIKKINLNKINNHIWVSQVNNYNKCNIIIKNQSISQLVIYLVNNKVKILKAPIIKMIIQLIY